jgi:hypothetical protein
MQDHKDEGSGGFLIRSPVHANDQAGVLEVAARQ